MYLRKLMSIKRNREVIKISGKKYNPHNDEKETF